ncbi:Zn-dependent hydrolase [Alkalihalobacillus sp. TS-13]|uniref:Zn-dependent hydrolase n=1 Tax=Alkalihalobacillus sp. TS-13 TaxID=2842455 RepID=UPI001C88D70C|nr:Zn-dependent hydrolase [Alkalihalobacillus sp. TS-13]
MLQQLLSDYDSSLSHSGVNGERLANRLEELSSIGCTSENGSYRLGFSAEERQAKELVKKWMTEAGLTVKEDRAGNVFGRKEGQNNLPAILSGSHVDSVPIGGHFDGPLGVLSALEVAQAWKETGYVPERPFEVVIFSDEEGSRFNGGLTGSTAFVGELDLERQRAMTDKDGLSFEQVLEKVGLSIETIAEAKRNAEEVALFVEVHIEQGKRLEKNDLPVGIVTGIAGPVWLEFTFDGEAGHAGNTPMNDRTDALAAASSFIGKVQELPETMSDSAVATVGKLNVYPNGVNVIPGQVKLYVDVRDIHEETRDQLINKILEAAEVIMGQTGVDVTWKEMIRKQPVPIRKDLQDLFSKAVEANGIEPFFLPSGAGHDAMIVGRHIPAAMLFVRSQDGVSHNPAEWSSLNDCIQGVHVLKTFLERSMDELPE